ncbi:MAG: lipid A hydroxylase LpxO [Alcaligenaceae bacterium]|nr:MAG: lipid A hydroxylase LpxO [Alcaligenaceae bacterium]
MKWIILSVWLSSILFFHFRSKVRLPVGRQLLDHSIFLAPLNALMVLGSRVATTPFLSTALLPELRLLQDNWQTIRDEALHLATLNAIQAPKLHNDVGFNSFFKYGWKRFYLKWYDVSHPSAERLCPKTVALLNQLPSVKAALFAELPAGGQLNPHRDPFAGSLRYHLGLSTPNNDLCYLEVDGVRHSWRDGQGVVFDETYVHSAYNRTLENRIILFCDIERPLKWAWAERFNHWFGRVWMAAANSPNDVSSDQTGFINKLTHYHWQVDQKRRAFKKTNRTLYKLTKFFLLASALGLFIYI